MDDRLSPTQTTTKVNCELYSQYLHILVHSSFWSQPLRPFLNPSKGSTCVANLSSPSCQFVFFYTPKSHNSKACSPTPYTVRYPHNMTSVREEIEKTTLLRSPTLPPRNYNQDEIKKSTKSVFLPGCSKGNRGKQGKLNLIFTFYLTRVVASLAPFG